ncbi:ATP-dependent translocase ABCB1-like [Oratosquilla oratoria]|uniref:ATP-dependent translocase ABCB1-like n=1 Tax=Oratosquilla oratoria TaxID=337810 RepID=UPI003F76CCA4
MGDVINLTNGSSKESANSVGNGQSKHTILTIDEYKSKEKKAQDSPKKKDGKEETDEGKEKNALPPVSFIALFRYSNRLEKWLIFLGFLAALVAGFCMPAMIILFGDVTNAFVYNEMNITTILAEIDSNDTDYLTELQNKYNIDFNSQIIMFGAGTAIIGLVQMVMGYVFVTTLNYAAEGQVYRLRGKFLQSILRQEIGWFDTHQTNDFASRVTEDLNKLQEGIGEKVGMFIFFLTIFLSSLVTAFIYGWELTLVILSVFPLLAISTGFMAKAQSTLTKSELEEYSKAGSIAEEVISSIRTVAAFGGESKEVDRYEQNLVFAKKAGIRRGLVTGVGMAFMWLIIYAAYALAFWYGTQLILDSRPPNPTKNYDPAKLIIVFFSVLMGAMNMGQAAPYAEAFSVARGAAATIYDIIERPSEIDPTSQEGKKLNEVKGFIEFEDVYFNYPSRPDVKILKGLNLKIQPGQTIALVGPSGCGKSTCIQLIQRFYDPLKGKVKVDNEDIRELNLGWLRDQIGVVGQEPVLFSTTIAENIRHGRDGVSIEQVIEAAKQANAHDFISRLPKQYDTEVGERGAQMSGGQKQRIAIARAIIKEPRILLLDEATSALDNQSEAVVQTALDKARKGRTTVVVAHRLSTIRNADVIVVFQDGKIKEMGNHKSLMAKDGLYFSLVTNQLTEEEKEKLKEEKEERPEDSTDDVTDLGQDIVDDLACMSPIALTRTPSVRRSLKRRRVSSSKVTPTVVNLKDESTKEDEAFEEVPTFKILAANAKEWPQIVVGSFASAVQGCCMPLYAILFGEVLGTLSIEEENEAQKEANMYAILFLVIGIVAAISMFLQVISFSSSGESLTMRLRKLTFEAMLHQEMGWFDRDSNSVGALCSRLSGDASSVQGATGSRVGTIMQSLTTLGVSIVLALYYNWKLGLVTLPFIPFVLIAVYLQSKILMGQSVTESKVLEDAGKIAIQAITNIRTVASLHKEEQFAMEYSTALLKPHLEAKKQSHLRGIAFGFAQSVPFFAYAAVMFYGGYLVVNEGLHYEKVFKVAEALILGTMMVGQAVAFAPNFSKAKVAASRIFQLLDRRPLINTSAGIGLRLSGKVSDIELKSVGFHYPTRPATTILTDLSVRVKRGQTLALVGSSGCGKSTIISLLERFYDANDGAVLIDTQNIQALNVGWVRGQLGLVSQEPVLFDRTIEENIAYGDNNRVVTKKEIIDAAQNANIHTFIESLPDGYNTRVGSKGTQLSGGQKQRVAIARALIRDPSVLLLDEATSALDTESEKVVQEALEQAQKGRTSIIIAHRLSTIQNADIIAVVQAGKVVEMGTHEELMKISDGHYYSLYQTNK